MKNKQCGCNPELLKAAVYSAHDGIITTFAVIAGVVGAHLSPQIVLVMGFVNIIADGISMALGDYLGEITEIRLRLKNHQPAFCFHPYQTGIVTFFSFIGAGILPLVPYCLHFLGIIIPHTWQFPASIIATGVGLFLVGTLRTIETDGKWWRNGLEVLGIGAIAATAAYFLGQIVEGLVTGVNL